MMREALRAIAASLREGEDDGEPFFPGDSGIPFSERNFHEIEPSPGVLCFVDGGNAEIASKPGVSVNLIRAYANLYDGDARMAWHDRVEFFSVVKAERDGDSLSYRAEHIFSGEQVLGPLRFAVFDSTIRKGPFMADIADIGGVVRRFAEWELARRAIPFLPRNAFIVRDGTLRTGVTGEAALADALFRDAASAGIGVGSVAKRSSLLTTTGVHLSAALTKRAPFARWYYHPLARTEDVAMAKLHELASQALRVECGGDMPRFMAALAANSADARLPGYPFGLVDADQFARVTQTEQKTYASLFALEDMHGRLNRLVE